MKNKIIKIIKWYLIIHLAISSMLLIDYAFFVKESTKITWKGRGYTVTKMILLAYIIHSGFISGYQNRYGDNLKPPTNVYHRMTA